MTTATLEYDGRNTTIKKPLEHLDTLGEKMTER